MNKIHTNKIYVLAGVPCAGKSWVCSQLTDSFHYVRHDDYIGNNYGGPNYLDAIIKAVSKEDGKPVLVEAPFGISDLVYSIRSLGDVEVVYIIEPDAVLEQRYLQREGRTIYRSHLTLQRTYHWRARHSEAFSGTSAECLQYLKDQVTKK